MAIVDECDFDMLSRFNWRTDHYGYVVYNTRRGGQQTTIKMARMIMLPEPKMDVDHRNRNKFDNRRVNLRACTRRQNLLNKGKGRPASSRYRGVYWDKVCIKWRSSICEYGRNKYIGIFRDEIDAAMAYDLEAIRCFGEFASPNFLEAV
jgi:hypothetical protein